MSPEVPPPPEPTVPAADPAPVPRHLARTFRWQALFQRSLDPLFVLDRRGRLLFVNRAWEELTNLSAGEAHLLVCRRQELGTPRTREEVLAHALTPPAEVLAGTAARVRRLLPGRGPAQRWWDVEFLPLRPAGRSGGAIVLGRIQPVPAEEAASLPPLPESLLTIRAHRAEYHVPELWDSPLPAVRRLAEQARLAARVTAPVLLVGAAGTGKETLARTIHHLGPRRERPFVALDCARLPPAVLAALLFDGPTAPGTLYLREPAALPRDLQARLAGQLARPGPDDPRVLAGSSVQPAEEAAAGRLVEELGCALATLVFEVPSLRERAADLPVLVERLLERANARAGPSARGLTPAAWEVVRHYPWPGNLRELYAVLAAARARATGGVIDAADLPAPLRLAVVLDQTPGPTPARPLPLKELLEQAERRLIRMALQRARGNKSRAAEMLAVWRPLLLRRMKALGIEDTDRGGPAPEGPDDLPALEL